MQGYYWCINPVIFFFLLNALVSGLQCILTGNMDFFLENHLIEHKNGSEVGVQSRGYE